MVHGNPTWGYLWRHFIPPLVEAGFRAIVPDHLGFGRSEKPDDPELYRVPRHAARFEALMESLDLKEATLVPHDWGGPIGLAWAARHPERVCRLAILNTFAHRPQDKVPLPISIKLFRTPGIGEVLVKGLHAFVRGFVFREGVRQHPNWSSRTPILVFPREIPLGPEGRVSDFLDGVHEGLRVFKERPVFIAWAMKDIALTPEMLDVLWPPDFPHARILRLPDAGHYLQEDAHEHIVPVLLEFLSGKEQPLGAA
jgi:haloalkane dehalogenase